MELSLERKVYGAILGVALTGLAIDRVFLSGTLTGPDSAAAGELPEAAAAPVVKTVAQARSAMSMLSEKIESFRTSLSPEREDAFVIPASVQQVLQDAGLPQVTTAPSIAEVPESTEMELRSVGNVGTPDAIARVGEHLLRLGEKSKHGLTLISLEQERNDDDPMSQTFVARVEDSSGRLHTLRMLIGSGRAGDPRDGRPR